MKNLLFVSIGDNIWTADSWGVARRDYDVFVCHYGQSEKARVALSGYCDHIEAVRGTKFQNLARVYHLLRDYDCVGVIDGDLWMPEENVRECFSELERLRVPVLSPAHHPDGKISWPHMIPTTKGVRFTNFVEMTAMFFQQETLRKLVDGAGAYWRGTLPDYGMDHLVAQFCGGPFAILDTVHITNPTDSNEMSAVGTVRERMEEWNRLREKFPALQETRNPWTYEYPR
jgi:hypothetical protein